MERPIIIDATESDDRASMPQSDILATLSMIDYLITQTRSIDEVSTACLVMAREALLTFASRLPKPH